MDDSEFKQALLAEAQAFRQGCYGRREKDGKA